MQVHGVAVAAQPAQELQPVHVRHEEVENQQVGHPLRDSLHRILSTGGFADVYRALEREQVRDAVPEVLVVVDDQDRSAL